MNPVIQKNKALEIVRAARVDRARAAALVLELIAEIAPEFGVTSAVLYDSKLSLNSVNGRLDAGDKKYFFKFHAEENETENLADAEYYGANLLADSGVPVLKPLFTSRRPGEQFVVYEYVEAQTAFEAYGTQEARRLSGTSYEEDRLGELLRMELQLCRTIAASFLKSLELSARATMESAAIQQLFYKRLVGTPRHPSRFETYYRGKQIALPDGRTIPFDDLARMRWEINGVFYEEGLEAIVANAKKLLDPAKEERTPSVIGHGDDHNGNRFIIDGKFTLFDVAFAGRQPALLSFVKATAHNVFAHPLWLYDPKQMEGRLKLDVTMRGETIIVNHNWDTEALSPLRVTILDLYAKEVWRPLVVELSERGWLSRDWQEYLRKALFCCPFLVLSLIDSNRFSPQSSVLALSKSVELGTRGNSFLEYFFNSIKPAKV